MQDIREVIRLATIIINNQQITGKKFQELDAEVKQNRNLLNTIINNQDTINKNVLYLMDQVSQLKMDK
ncbi:hypothetical protein EI546_03340 [Aequorivita sp. H23M31]|uniref:Uncharacterized protein n=1 Tax=Aequorivita ciconiae TaxID=2494375 RepID=A0A410G0R6_9FLAO|nr:hypothetical protein [Aequorivita sp. H23M31]QAA80820.1 hypothetical protein EI546_03340 [Aequorivita sp. H23M31]